jgi:CRISPR-associated protein (TIGR02710 family)
MPRGMIISVGASPDPIVKTIEEHKPEFICFFASQETVEFIRDIKKALEDKGLKGIKDKKIMVNNINDLVHCYKKAREALSVMSEEGIQPEEIIVDYTGGTKTMTASLALATLTKGAKFSYVGGEKRTKKGVGVVISGTEIIEEGVSPWQIYAVDEKQRIAQYFNLYQFDAALALTTQIKPRIEKRQRPLLEKLESIIKAYQSWDIFNHLEAIRFLSTSIKGLRDYVDISEDKDMQEFCQKAGENIEFLKKLQEKTKQFNRLHNLLVVDLVSNAQRRAEECKFDDACARLYRALEMIGQIEFEKMFGCSNSEVSPDKIPERLRNEYIPRYMGKKDKLQLPLFATFRVLKEKNNKNAIVFFEKEEEFKKLLDVRNNSILAHGFTSVKENTYKNLLKLLVETFEIKDIIYFPKLRW